MASKDDWAIGVCTADQRRAALTLVLQSVPAHQRGPLVESMRGFADDGLGPFSALVTAARGGKLIAAAWAQPQPGRTASLWPPEPTSALPANVALQLIQTAMETADASGVAMSQTLLEHEKHPHLDAMRSCGFQRVAKLCYLEWLPSSGAPPKPAAEVRFEPDANSDPERLAALITSTYVDTLDCPSLEGLRNIADTLEGYRQVGRHNPKLWFLLRHADRDAGVLLLAEHPESNQCELVYMGLAPHARGKHIGEAAVAYAQAVAKRRASERLVLAVDAENTPAFRLYERSGFRAWASRVVYVRPRNSVP